MVYYDKDGIVIRDLRQSDVQIITDAEIAQGWDAAIDKYGICGSMTMIAYMPCG